MVKLLSSLSVQVNERVNEVWHASANVKEVDELIVEVEVEYVRHLLGKNALLSATAELILSYLMIGSVCITNARDKTYSMT